MTKTFSHGCSPHANRHFTQRENNKEKTSREKKRLLILLISLLSLYFILFLYFIFIFPQREVKEDFIGMLRSNKLRFNHNHAVITVNYLE